MLLAASKVVKLNEEIIGKMKKNVIRILEFKEDLGYIYFPVRGWQKTTG